MFWVKASQVDNGAIIWVFFAALTPKCHTVKHITLEKN